MGGPSLVATGFFSILLVTLGYGALHSLLASHWVKNKAGRIFGAAGKTYYRLVFNTIAIATLIPVTVVELHFLGPVLYRWTGYLAAAAIMGQAIAILLLIGAFLQSRPAAFLGLQRAVSEQPSAGLMMSGACAIVRHPLYTTGLAFLWLTPIMTTGILAFNIGATLYTWIGSEWEERRLIGEFGEEYKRYQSKVARLIPFIY
jgi:protein-S-isoprenylcysteine O-methyltransferase Ste14